MDDAIGAFGGERTGKETGDFRADLETKIAEGREMFRAGTAAPDGKEGHEARDFFKGLPWLAHCGRTGFLMM